MMEAIEDNRKPNKKKKRKRREKDARWKRDGEVYYTKKKMTEWYAVKGGGSRGIIQNSKF